MSGAAAAGGAGAIVRQGHLRKLKTMKKKYFVLRAETAEGSARLEYYESEKKFRSGAVARRVLPLKSCYNITRRLDLKQKHVIALFTREEQFCVVADNEKDLHLWLTDILKQNRSDDASEELLHPIQHVWQVNVQKKGLGASRNIQGLYNLCLTDKTLALVKIKSHNNVISDLGIPERVEYGLKNIRRCGDSECFFYMEVGRQTTTGAGEIWMHSDDSNIAQSMHSTIYHAMKNCAKESENERDHIVVPGRASAEGRTLPARRQTYSDGHGRAGLANEKGLCVGSCIRQCVCATATYSIDDSAAAIAPLTPKNAADYHHNSLTSELAADAPRVSKHHRTVSLPAGSTLFQEPLKIVHERTRSAPLTGDEVDRATIDKAVRHSSCKTVNGTDVLIPRKQWSRRASTGTRLSKLSPAHTKNASALRNRCDSMPSRVPATLDLDRIPTRHEIEGMVASRDEADGEWVRAPGIPEEPDYCEMFGRDLVRSRLSSGAQVSVSSLTGEEDGCAAGTGGTGVRVAGGAGDAGYLPMAPLDRGLVSASSGSVCSGTPSTDPRFSEYQLDPATSHIVQEERPARAYSVGSRPAPAPDCRHRAYSVGARHRPLHHQQAPRHHSGRSSASAPLLPRASAEDLMELDFSNNQTRTPPPPAAFLPAPPTPLARVNLDEYVDMSPRGARLPASVSPPPVPVTPATPATPDGYVEMNYTPRRPSTTKPIDIATRPKPTAGLVPSPPTPSPAPSRPDPGTPLGSQTLFHLSLDSPASPVRPEEHPVLHLTGIEEPHPLSTVREISEEGRRSPEVSSSPLYVKLTEEETNATKAESSGVTLVRAGVGPPARFSVVEGPGQGPVGLNYAALDLEPRGPAAAPPPRLYTEIDFIRSEKLHADAN